MAGNRLQDRVCLITGGSSGIGRAIAIRFAKEGAVVSIVARDQSELTAVAKEIAESGGEAQAIVGDVTDPTAMRRATEEVVSRWGKLDIVVANAGINGVWAPIEDLSVEDWRRTIEVNLTGAFITLKAAVPALRHAGGSVIVVSSVNGTRVFSNRGASAYSSSKAGQVALAKMLALELAKHNIRVNVLCPGAIGTSIHEKTVERHGEEAREPVEFPQGRIPLTDGQAGSPDEVASVAVFLASEEASHVTGSLVYVDGGESLLQG